MSVSGVSQSDLYALLLQRRLDFQTMSKAVKAGNTSAAQGALTSYQADVQSIDAATGTSDADSTTQSSPFATKIKTDLTTLTSAVQSGDMSSAQSALKAYAQDQASFGSGANDGDADDTSSSIVKDLTGLVSSIQSGDSSGTQTSADALVKDLQSILQGSGGPQGAHGHHHHHGGPPPTDAQNNTTDPTSGTTSATASTTNDSSDPLTQLLNDFTNLVKEMTQGTSQAAA